jgi:hypothetical protein
MNFIVFIFYYEMCFSISLLLFWVFLVGLGFEVRASWLQSRCFTASATPPVHFALVILEMRFLKLFVWACLELTSAQSQPSN